MVSASNESSQSFLFFEHQCDLTADYDVINKYFVREDDQVREMHR